MRIEFWKKILTGLGDRYVLSGSYYTLSEADIPYFTALVRSCAWI